MLKIQRLIGGECALMAVIGDCCLFVSVKLCDAQWVPAIDRLSIANHTATQERAPAEWPTYQVEGTSYRVALSSDSGELGKPGSRRVMVLFLNESEFREDRVLRIFSSIDFRVPQPTTLYVTVLTDKGSVSERLQQRNWESSLDDNYSRLTEQPQHCCPASFKGAQFERYASRSLILVCDNGKSKEIVLEH
jgi:hypothetical protein